jgi:hypothetical protein
VSRVRSVFLTAVAAAALGGWMSSGASAANEAVASPNPAAQQTYKLYLSSPEEFGSITVNTATDTCTYEFPPLEITEVKEKAVCSLGSAESSVSAWIHFAGKAFDEEIGFTIVFTVHRRSGPVAYSGLGVEFVHSAFGRRVLPVLVQLKA